MSIIVRPYEPKDRHAAEGCLKVLQDYQRAFESDRIDPEQMASPYLDFLLRKCQEAQGRLFVAVASGEVVGFSSVWIEQGFDNLVSDRKPYAYLADSVVIPTYRDRGIGTLLLKAREEYVQGLGIKHLTIEALWKNDGLRGFAAVQGYREYLVTFVKELF